MVLLEVPEAHNLTAYLKAHNIYTDSRRDEVVRMAPFLWNTEAEVDRTFDRIEEGLDTGAYREATVSSAGPVT
jgi:kynureninase